MLYHSMNIQHIQYWISVLCAYINICKIELNTCNFTLAKLAVNTTISYFSPILRMNSSTPGRFNTYTLWYWLSISTGTIKSGFGMIYFEMIRMIWLLLCFHNKYLLPWMNYEPRFHQDQAQDTFFPCLH